MKSVCFVLMVVVVLGMAGVGASAGTVDVCAGGPAGDGIVLPAGTGANAPTADAPVGDPVVVAAVSPDSQAGAAESKTREKKRFYVSVNVYGFVPTDSEARDNFGGIWGSFGIGRFRPERPMEWVFDWDATIWVKSDESRALLIPVTVGAQRGLSQDPDRQSYVALRVGPYYGKVDDNLQGPDGAAVGLNVNLALGMVVDQKYVFEARYDWFSKLKGNTLNGVTLSAGIKVFSFSF